MTRQRPPVELKGNNLNASDFHLKVARVMTAIRSCLSCSKPLDTDWFRQRFIVCQIARCRTRPRYFAKWAGGSLSCHDSMKYVEQIMQFSCQWICLIFIHIHKLFNIYLQLIRCLISNIFTWGQVAPMLPVCLAKEALSLFEVPTPSSSSFLYNSRAKCWVIQRSFSLEYALFHRKLSRRKCLWRCFTKENSRTKLSTYPLSLLI